MKHVVFPPQEAERLAALYRYEVLDTAPDESLDDLVHLAAFICHAPIAVISLVDSDRQWFKSKLGLTATQTDRVIAFCAHTILDDELFVVPDTLEDKRFVENPLVTGDPNIRFYCGAPLTTPDGYRIGTLSVIDRVPRELSPEQFEAMRVLSHQVMDHLNLDRRHKELVTAVGERLKAEQALVASQTKFQRLSDCTSAGIYIYRGERFLYTNPAAQTITGYSLEELQSLSLWDLVHPDFHETLKARMKAVEAGDQAPAQFEFPIITKDRQIRWLDFSAASIEFEGQQARIGTAIDRTERRQAEALNRVQRHVLEMISRNKPLPDVMHAVIQMIEALSDQGVCTILLLDPATGTLRNGATSTMPEDFCRAVDGAPVGPQVGSCGTAAYRKAAVIVTDIAGDPLWAPWIGARRLILSLGFKACTSIPILDSRGEVLGTYAMYYKSARGPTRYEVKLLEVSSFLLGIALDRKHSDEALRVSEERMEAILSNSPLMVFLKDRAGRYLFTNRMFEQQFGLSHRQAIGRTDAELFAPDQAAAFQANDEKVLRSGMPMEFEERARYDDGDHTSIVTKFPLRQPDGTVYALGGIVTDITERRRMEEELQRSFHRLRALGREVQWAEEKERRRLSRELHDEFGQLLSALRMSLARVREELQKRPRAGESVLMKNVSAAMKAAEHLFVSLRELVHGLRPAVLDEFGLVAALESMAENIGQTTGLACRLSIEPNNVDTLIEQEMKGALFRIAQELVTNVVRHAKATKADLVLRCADGTIALTVQDNGRGGRLTIAKGKYGLRGIRERTELLGGTVEIRSEHRRGTTVTVIIPLSLRRPPDSRDLSEPLVTAENPKRRRHGKNMQMSDR